MLMSYSNHSLRLTDEIMLRYFNITLSRVLFRCHNGDLSLHNSSMRSVTAIVLANSSLTLSCVLVGAIMLTHPDLIQL